MILKKGTFAAFAQRVEAMETRVIIYGAGVIGETAAPYWLHEYQLDEAVMCFVDADIHKQGKSIRLASRDVPVGPLTVLTEQSGNYILLITVSAFEPVVRSLEQLPGTENVEAYFLPIMLLDIAHASKKVGVVRTSDVPLIPKKIHYTWFSGEPIPVNLQKCIDTWKRVCPDYEIVRWDTNNYDISKREYTRQAYAHRKWGFIADMARLDIIYQNGGIYLDVDVELLRPLDSLLYEPGFCSTEKWGIVSGAVFGAQAGNPAIKSILDYRSTVIFQNPDGTLNLTSSGTYDTLPLIQQGLKMNGETQIIANGEMTVYSSDFFQPYDYASGELHTTKNTFSIHHFDGGWLGEAETKGRAKTQLRYKEFLSRLEG